MAYLELYNKDLLDIVSLGKTVYDFDETIGDYIKVEVFNDAATSPLGIFYSNRLLLKYSNALR